MLELVLDAGAEEVTDQAAMDLWFLDALRPCRAIGHATPQQGPAAARVSERIAARIHAPGVAAEGTCMALGVCGVIEIGLGIGVLGARLASGHPETGRKAWP